MPAGHDHRDQGQQCQQRHSGIEEQNDQAHTGSGRGLLVGTVCQAGREHDRGARRGVGCDCGGRRIDRLGVLAVTDPALLVRDARDVRRVVGVDMDPGGRRRDTWPPGEGLRLTCARGISRRSGRARLRWLRHLRLHRLTGLVGRDAIRRATGIAAERERLHESRPPALAGCRAVERCHQNRGHIPRVTRGAVDRRGARVARASGSGPRCRDVRVAPSPPDGGGGAVAGAPGRRGRDGAATGDDQGQAAAGSARSRGGARSPAGAAGRRCRGPGILGGGPVVAVGTAPRDRRRIAGVAAVRLSTRAGPAGGECPRAATVATHGAGDRIAS